MIAPRRTRLVSVPDLKTFRRQIAESAVDPDPWVTRGTAVIVSSRAAASELRTTIENLMLAGAPDAGWAGGAAPAGPAIVLPDLVTRAEWYARLHAALPAGGGRMLSAIEREVLMARAASEAVSKGLRPPFSLRPGLLVEILAFYDALARQGTTIEKFERLVTSDLLPRVDIDRGAARLLDQTRFLVSAFRTFESLVQASGRLDEHTLRARLLAGGIPSPYRRVVLTTGDWVTAATGEGGFHRADFALLARLDGIERIDIIATSNVLASGLLERLREELPGLEEVIADSEVCLPVLVAPPPAEQRLYWTSRDREDELEEVARRIKTESLAAAAPPLERTAVVFRRPLPYVYLAQAVFAAARVPWQVFDRLPLAAEPFAAAVDLVLGFAASSFRPSAAMALLRSPHLVFTDPERERETGSDAVALLERLLDEAGLPDEPQSLEVIAGGNTPGGEDASARSALRTEEREAARSVARAALVIRQELEPLSRSLPASRQLATLHAFLVSHGRIPSAEDPAREATLRCRAAILAALEEMSAAHSEYFDPSLSIASLAPSLRRWMEGQTFTPASGQGGVHLVDAATARYGDFDNIHIVGLVEGEWPPRGSPNIFYPPFLLAELGWPSERSRTEAFRASFLDLLGLGSRVFLSTFTLEDDVIVEPAALLEDVDGAGVRVERQPEGRSLTRVFEEEALVSSPERPEVLREPAASWAAIRMSRSDAKAPEFRGRALPAARRSYAVRAVEEYVKCPFRYFARYVLRLPERPRDERAVAARTRGTFAHDVMRIFFENWQVSGRGAITQASIDEARSTFRTIVESRLEEAPPRDRMMLRLRLLGSPAAAGIADVLARIEVERNVEVVERLLEFPLDGPCLLRTAERSRTVRVTAVADRIDLLADGTFDVIDYKLGRAPDPKHAVQLPMYAAQATSILQGRHGRSWQVRDAFYLPLSGSAHTVSIRSQAGGMEQSIAAGQERFLAAVEGIEKGEFPPRPAEMMLCSTCAYASVCRKDYRRGD